MYTPKHSRNPCILHTKPVRSLRPRCCSVTSRNGDGAPLSKPERGGLADGGGGGDGVTEMEMGKNLGDEEEFDESPLLSFFPGEG